jgi:hypothetical protein
MSEKTNYLSIILLLFFFLLLSTQKTRAETYIPDWNISANFGTLTDQPSDVDVDSNNNIIIVGYMIPVKKDMWNITKLNKTGSLLWSYTYGSGIADELASGVAVDPHNNDFVVVGSYNASNQTNDYGWKIMKFNQTNDKLWDKTFNISYGNDQPVAVAIDSQYNIIVAGYYNASSKLNDYGWYILKLDGNGNTYPGWNISFNFSDYSDRSSDVAIDKDDNITVVGYDNVTSSREWKIMKFDKDLKSIKNYTADISIGQDQAQSVAIDHDGGIIVAGHDYSSGNMGWRIMRFDNNLNSIYNYTNDTSTTFDNARGITVDKNDNNVTVVGYYTIPPSDRAWLIKKIGYDNTTLWSYEKNISNFGDEAVSVVADYEDNIIVVGFDGLSSSDSQWRVMKFKKACDSNNDCECWEECAPVFPHTYKTCNNLRTNVFCNYLDNCNNCNMGSDCPNSDDLCYNDYCWNAPRRTCIDDTALCHVLFVQCVPQTTTTT